jgi:hypothetical protein
MMTHAQNAQQKKGKVWTEKGAVIMGVTGRCGEVGVFNLFLKLASDRHSFSSIGSVFHSLLNGDESLSDPWRASLAIS